MTRENYINEAHAFCKKYNLECSEARIERVWDRIFARDDEDGDGRISFAEFDSRLPASTRQAIEARLNKEGMLNSLYIPPEQWTEDRTRQELNWERKVQMQAQREGNQLRQNDILGDELGKM